MRKCLNATRNGRMTSSSGGAEWEIGSGHTTMTGIKTPRPRMRMTKSPTSRFKKGENALSELRISPKELSKMCGLSENSLRVYLSSWQLFKYCRRDDAFSTRLKFNIHFTRKFIEDFAEYMQLKKRPVADIWKFRRLAYKFINKLKGDKNETF